MKYMTFNNSCSYCALSIMLEEFNIDINDKEIANEMGLPFLLEYDGENFISGANLQGEYYFNLFLETRDLIFKEEKIERKDCVEYLTKNTNSMIGLVVNENKHAYVFKGIENDKLVFINPHRLNDNENDYLIIKKDELPSYIDDYAFIGNIVIGGRESEGLLPYVKSFQTFDLLYEQFSNLDIETKLNSIDELKDSLFRTIAIDLFSMSQIIGNKELNEQLENSRNVIFHLFKESVLSIDNKNLLLETIQSYKSEVLKYINDRYLLNPTEELSVSLSKSLRIDYGIGLKIKRTREISESYKLNIYSKLVYYPDIDLPVIKLDDVCLRELNYKDIDDIVRNINNAYENIAVDPKEVRDMLERDDYCSKLWIGAFHENELIGSIIGTFDNEIKEVYLEWIQVDRDKRRKKIGEKLLVEFLKIAKEFSRFVTVCCELNNPTNPIRLYKKTGFTDETYWIVGS